MKKLLTITFLLTVFGFVSHSTLAAALPTVTLPTTMNAEQAPAIDAKAIPAAPSNLQASSVTGTSLTLTWTLNSSDATEIHVEGKVSSASSYTEANGSPVSGGSNGVIVNGLIPGTTYDFRVRASNSDGFSPYSNVVTVTTSSAPACTTTATTGCLIGDRFQVQATYMTGAGASGNAHVVMLTDNSAYLWFFDQTNAEVLLKILDACTVNNQFWFFAGGLTNVKVVITITDTQNPTEVKTYTNKLNTVFAPIQDTSALTCP